MLREDVERFVEVADSVFEKGMEIVDLVPDALREAEALRQEIALILASAAATAEEPGLQQFYSDIAQAHDRLFDSVVAIASRVGSIPNRMLEGAQRFKAHSSALTQRMDGTNPDARLAEEMSRLLSHAVTSAELNHHVQRFYAGL